MATALLKRRCSNIGQLRAFIKDIPEGTPICANFRDDKVFFYLWEAEKNESGPRKYVGFEEE